MPVSFHVTAADVPDAEWSLHALHRDARRLARRHPALTRIGLDLHEAGADAFEVSADLRLPQHQLIVSGVGPTTATAIRAAYSEAVAGLERIQERDATLAQTPYTATPDTPAAAASARSAAPRDSKPNSGAAAGR